MFGQNRTRFNCYDRYCHFKDPKFILKVLGVKDDEKEFNDAVFVCGVYIVVTCILTLTILRLRLRYQ